TKGAPKQLIAHNTPPREPPIPAQTVQQEPSIPPQTVQQESSIPRQTLLQSILKSVKRAWVRLVTQRGLHVIPDAHHRRVHRLPLPQWGRARAIRRPYRRHLRSLLQAPQPRNPALRRSPPPMSPTSPPRSHD